MLCVGSAFLGSGSSGLGCGQQIKEYLGLMTFEALFGGEGQKAPRYLLMILAYQRDDVTAIPENG